MPEILTISKQKPASKAADFQFLADKALRYTQLVAGNNWTDYNTHDPGRTILEQLAYAINDLAYRTSMPIADLLAEDNGEAGKQTHFFTPRKILSSNPVSVDDFRKTLIDLPGIKNAWLAPRIEDNFYSDGPAIYHNKQTQKLHYLDNEPVEEEDLIRISGLYDILLEFENHENYGELNGNSIRRTLEITQNSNPLKGFKLMLAAEFPYWDDSAFPDLPLDRFDPKYKEVLAIELIKRVQDIDITIYRRLENLRIQISHHAEDNEILVEVTEKTSRERQPALEADLKKQLNGTLKLLAADYLERIEYIKGLVKTVNKQLYRHRNLCEDFINIKSVKVKEVAICIKIDLHHQARQNTVAAHIFYALEQFLSPQLEWSSLEELMAQGMPVDEIFEGPALNNGFLTDDQMTITDRRRILYVSDLINIIQDIDGVKFLSEIEMGLKKDGVFTIDHEGKQWHLELSEESESLEYYIPRLNIDHSNIRFFKDRIPLSTSRDEVNQQLEILRANKQELEKPITLDLQAPKGTSQQVGEYVSIQTHFPGTYQIGERGPSPLVNVSRKGQIKQLKGYLLVFEQLLANYLAQLANVNQLFSLDTNISNTYFSQGLYEVPHVADLLIDFVESSGLGNNPEEDDKRVFKRKWEQFLENAENAYITRLKDISEGKVEERTENESVFTDRRNRFLDHLMARFQEQIDDYANIMHSIDADTSANQLIIDKARLLQDYPAISSLRGKGFDCLDNGTGRASISGLELRMARLLGIDLYNMSGVGAVYETFEDNEGKYRFRIKDHTGEIILNSTQGYENEDELTGLKEQVFEAAMNPNLYQRKTDRRGRLYLNLLGAAGAIIARSQEYHKNESDRLDELLNMIDSLRKMDEKVHVLEHILLRPKIKGVDQLLPVREPTDLNWEEETCCSTPPYSFMISVVLPSWPKRFRNLEFRRYVEEKIRLETPAHIYARICWVNHAHMAAFEQKLTAWKQAIAKVDFNDDLFLAQIAGDFMAYVKAELEASYQLLDDEAPNPIEPNSRLIRRQIRKLKEKAKEKRLTPELRLELLMLIDRLEKAEKLLNRSTCHNALIEVLDLLRTIYPEATLYDCEEGEAENPIALNRTILGSFKPLEEDE